MPRVPAIVSRRALPYLLGLGAALACTADMKDGLSPDGTPGSRSIVGISVSPAQVSLPLGGSKIFSVSTVRADGTLNRMNSSKVQWSATGGTIANGSYVAGRVSGLYHVIAYDPVRRLGDTAAVSVGDPGSPVLVSITLSPASASLAPGATQQFAASGLMSDGSAVNPAVTWSATGGAINGSGLYTAGTVSGAYRVIAAAGGVADTAAVNITGLTSLVSVTVSPGTASIPEGKSQQFSASGKLSDGSTTTPAVTWSATGGSISAAGLYTAGTTTGTFRVIGTAGSVADTSSITVTTPVLQSITVSPASATLLLGGTQQFSVSGRMSDGSAVNPAVTWSATGGAINGSGLYTAGTVSGTYRVIAAAGGVADTAAVAVTGVTSLVSITVSPGSTTLPEGATQQFSASAKLNDGSTTTPTVTWTATGGTISSTGVYTAGSNPGTFRVIGASGSLADTSSITVTAPLSGSNEPAGLVAFAIHSASSIPLYPSSTIGALGGSWYSYPQGDPDLTLGTDVNAPASPSSTIVTRFYTGLPGGSAPVNWGGWDVAGSGAAGEKSELYFSMWIRVEGTDYENQAVGTKAGFLAVGRDPSQGQNETTFFLQGTGQQAIQSAFSVQFKQQGQVARNLDQNVNTQKLMTCGAWHHWEAVLKLNTLGQSNGVFKMWIDGAMTHNYSDVVYITSTAPHGFNLFKWNPTWGGQGGTRTRNDYIDIDHVYISGLP